VSDSFALFLTFFNPILQLIEPFCFDLKNDLIGKK